jgi:hypothetical protein
MTLKTLITQNQYPNLSMMNTANTLKQGFTPIL